MNRFIILLLLLAVGQPLLAVKPPDLKVNEEQARTSAFSTYVKHRKLNVSAIEGARQPMLIQLGFPVKDFSSEGEWVWEVRILNLNEVLQAIIWVHTVTGKSHYVTGK